MGARKFNSMGELLKTVLDEMAAEERLKNEPKYMAKCPACGNMEPATLSNSQKEDRAGWGFSQCPACNVYMEMLFDQETKTFKTRVITKTEIVKMGMEEVTKERERIGKRKE